MTFGNASSDTITMTGSVASHVNPSAHNTYDFGTVTTLGWRALYLASSSATKTIKFQGSATSSDLTITAPSRTGTIEVVPSVSASKTTTYSVLTTDDLVLCDASSGSFTVTLPTAASAAGKMYWVKRTDQTLANAVTIATTSSQTIDGVTTRKLCTQYEIFKVISDGSNWHILEHWYPSGYTSYTPTITGFGTASNVAFKWKRVGDSAIIEGYFTSGTSTAVTAEVTLPSGLTSASAGNYAYAAPKQDANGANNYAILVAASATTMRFGVQSAGTNALTASVGSSTLGAGTTISWITHPIPITNWEA